MEQDETKALLENFDEAIETRHNKLVNVLLEMIDAETIPYEIKKKIQDKLFDHSKNMYLAGYKAGKRISLKVTVKQLEEFIDAYKQEISQT